MVLVEIVAGSIFSLKNANTRRLRGTPVAPLAGFTETTVGAVLSVSVVNDELNVTAKAFPAKSFTLGSVAPPKTRAV